MPIEPVNKNLLCKDCLHSFVPWFDAATEFSIKETMRCKKTGTLKFTNFSPVTGYESKELRYDRCYVERDRYGGCGPSARNWSPKHKKDLFKVFTR